MENLVVCNADDLKQAVADIVMGVNNGLYSAGERGITAQMPKTIEITGVMMLRSNQFSVNTIVKSPEKVVTSTDTTPGVTVITETGEVTVEHTKPVSTVKRVSTEAEARTVETMTPPAMHSVQQDRTSEDTLVEKDYWYYINGRSR